MHTQKHTAAIRIIGPDLNTGLDYWTHIFLGFAHSEVIFVVSLKTKTLQGAFCHCKYGD